MFSNSRFHDVIVIGVGGMGSAACYYLAKQGKRVLGLERYSIPHTHGSSHGLTRIIRKAYYEDLSYIPLIQRSYELWHELERVAGERLLHKTGSIDSGPEDSWVFQGSWKSCRLHEFEHTVYTGAELKRYYPAYNLPREHLALYQPDGGFLLPERCVVNYVMAAQALGAEIHGHEQVLEWQALESGVRVVTNRGTYEAEKLVITAGAWEGDFLEPLRGLAVPERQVLAWLQPTKPERFRSNNFPVFNSLVEEGRFYGFPQHGVPGFKFGKYHHLEEAGAAETIDYNVYPRDEELLRNFAERYFPDGCGPTMSLAACMFTNTPDKHFIMDLHPDYSQVAFASACSGHGYKFASVIGEIMADLAMNGRTRHDITSFRLNRFSNSSSKQQTVEDRKKRFRRSEDIKSPW